MKTPFLRQILACLAALVAAASPAWAETNSSQFLINQWIRQSEDGSIGGKLVLPQADAAVLAVNPAVVGLASGRSEMKTTHTDEEGAFRFEGVEPGVYTLISRGAKDACSVIALHVVSFADDQAAGLPQEVELAAGQLKFASVNTMMIRYLPPSPLMHRDDVALNVDFATIASHVSTRSMHQIIQSNGGLEGQVYGPGANGNRLNPSSQINVFLFRNGEEIHRAVSDNSGAFRVESLSPGVYSALLVGASGMGLVGFELISELEDRGFTSVDREGALVHTQDSAASSQLVMQVAPGDAVVGGFQEMGVIPSEVVSDVVIGETVVSEEIVDTGFVVPMGGGGYAGGPGGGGGGGGRGQGGHGGLLGIAGLVTGIVALATSDDTPPPPPATPADL